MRSIRRRNYIIKESKDTVQVDKRLYYTPSRERKTIKEGKIDGYAWKIVSNGNCPFLYVTLNSGHPLSQCREIYTSNGAGIGNWIGLPGRGVSYWQNKTVGFDFWEDVDAGEEKRLWTVEKIEKLAHQLVQDLKKIEDDEESIRILDDALYGDDNNYDDNYDSDYESSDNNYDDDDYDDNHYHYNSNNNTSNNTSNNSKSSSKKYNDADDDDYDDYDDYDDFDFEDEFDEILKRELNNFELGESLTHNKRSLYSLKESREVTTATNRLIKTLYKEVDDLTSHIYRDNDWRYVNNVFQRIEDVIGSDGELSVWCENGGYIKDREGTPVCKEWHLKIELNNGGLIGGVVKAHTAGSVMDPFDAYDITCTFWRE